jgi:hypothetical protein
LQGAWFVLLKYPAYCDSLSLCNGVAEIHGMCMIPTRVHCTYMSLGHDAAHAMALFADPTWHNLQGKWTLTFEWFVRPHLHGRQRQPKCTLVLNDQLARARLGLGLDGLAGCWGPVELRQIRVVSQLSS